MSPHRRPGAGKPLGDLARYVAERERVLGRGCVEHLAAQLLEAVDRDLSAAAAAVADAAEAVP